MKVTRKEFDDARAKCEKLKAKFNEAVAVVKTWTDAEKKEPARDGEEVVAYVIEDDGTVMKMARTNGKVLVEA